MKLIGDTAYYGTHVRFWIENEPLGVSFTVPEGLRKDGVGHRDLPKLLDHIVRALNRLFESNAKAAATEAAVAPISGLDVDTVLVWLDLHPNFAEAATVIREQRAAIKRIREWLDSNTTFYDVDPTWQAPHVATLAQVSKRIWYHATDDQASYPFSEVMDATLARINIGSGG